jgi:hypothetical protein
MSAYRRRIEGLQTLVAGSVIATANPAEAQRIDDELGHAGTTINVPQLPRRRLLQILHTTRSLDSLLTLFCAHYAIPGNPTGLGSYLTALVNNIGHPTLSPMPSATRDRYRTSIAGPRNTYMHRADAFPATDGEVMRLVSEMHACITEVLNL